jgi:hypothetical protein
MVNSGMFICRNCFAMSKNIGQIFQTNFPRATYNIMDNKKIGTGKAEAAHNSNHNVIEVMKPFVSFGVKALTLLGSVLVHIVKNIPKPHDHKQAPKKNDKVIKI